MCLISNCGRWVTYPPGSGGRLRKRTDSAPACGASLAWQPYSNPALGGGAARGRPSRGIVSNPQKDPFPIVEEPEVGLSPEQRPSVPRQSGPGTGTASVIGQGSFIIVSLLGATGPGRAGWHGPGPPHRNSYSFASKLMPTVGSACWVPGPFSPASAARATGSSTSEFAHIGAAGRAVFLYEEPTLHPETVRAGAGGVFPRPSLRCSGRVGPARSPPAAPPQAPRLVLGATLVKPRTQR